MEAPPSAPQQPHSSPPSGPVPPFVQQLARMTNEGHIAWSDAGDEVVVADTKRFADEVCPLYFKHRNWTSFARMMNMYDFAKTPDGNGARFRHAHFRRGADEERWRVQRRRSTTKKRPSTDNTDVWVRRGLVLERRVAKLAEENALLKRVRDVDAAMAAPPPPSLAPPAPPGDASSWGLFGLEDFFSSTVDRCCRVDDAAPTPMASEDVRHFAVADDNPMDFDWDEEMLDTTRIDM